MKRISNDPEERRLELIDAAERLFIERGYEHTAISGIVKELNIAQGTLLLLPLLPLQRGYSGGSCGEEHKSNNFKL